MLFRTAAGCAGAAVLPHGFDLLRHGSAGQITDDIRNVQPEIQDDRDDQADQRGEISRQGDGVPCIRTHCDTFSLNALAMASSAA